MADATSGNFGGSTSNKTTQENITQISVNGAPLKNVGPGIFTFRDPTTSKPFNIEARLNYAQRAGGEIRLKRRTTEREKGLINERAKREGKIEAYLEQAENLIAEFDSLGFEAPKEITTLVIELKDFLQKISSLEDFNEIDTHLTEGSQLITSARESLRLAHIENLKEKEHYKTFSLLTKRYTDLLPEFQTLKTLLSQENIDDFYALSFLNVGDNEDDIRASFAHHKEAIHDIESQLKQVEDAIKIVKEKEGNRIVLEEALNNLENQKEKEKALLQRALGVLNLFDIKKSTLASFKHTQSYSDREDRFTEIGDKMEALRPSLNSSSVTEEDISLFEKEMDEFDNLYEELKQAYTHEKRLEQDKHLDMWEALWPSHIHLAKAVKPNGKNPGSKGGWKKGDTLLKEQIGWDNLHKRTKAVFDSYNTLVKKALEGKLTEEVVPLIEHKVALDEILSSTTLDEKNQISQALRALSQLESAMRTSSLSIENSVQKKNLLDKLSALSGILKDQIKGPRLELFQNEITNVRGIIEGQSTSSVSSKEELQIRLSIAKEKLQRLEESITNEIKITHANKEEKVKKDIVGAQSAFSLFEKLKKEISYLVLRKTEKENLQKTIDKLEELKTKYKINSTEGDLSAFKKQLGLLVDFTVREMGRIEEIKLLLKDIENRLQESLGEREKEKLLEQKRQLEEKKGRIEELLSLFKTIAPRVDHVFQEKTSPENEQSKKLEPGSQEDVTEKNKRAFDELYLIHKKMFDRDKGAYKKLYAGRASHTSKEVSGRVAARILEEKVAEVEAAIPDITEKMLEADASIPQLKEMIARADELTVRITNNTATEEEVKELHELERILVPWVEQRQELTRELEEKEKEKESLQRMSYEEELKQIRAQANTDSLTMHKGTYSPEKKRSWLDAFKKKEEIKGGVTVITTGIRPNNKTWPSVSTVPKNMLPSDAASSTFLEAVTPKNVIANGEGLVRTITQQDASLSINEGAKELQPMATRRGVERTPATEKEARVWSDATIQTISGWIPNWKAWIIGAGALTALALGNRAFAEELTPVQRPATTLEQVISWKDFMRSLDEQKREKLTTFVKDITTLSYENLLEKYIPSLDIKNNRESKMAQISSINNQALLTSNPEGIYTDPEVRIELSNLVVNLQTIHQMIEDHVAQKNSYIKRNYIYSSDTLSLEGLYRKVQNLIGTTT